MLTKPIGTGILTTAAKQGQATSKEELRSIQEATNWMGTLNKKSADVAQKFNVHAATDVTGFGLLGHLREMMVDNGELTAVLHADKVPALAGAKDLAELGVVPGGTQNNFEMLAPDVMYHDDVDRATQYILCDAVTSGGLLLAVRPEDVTSIQSALKEIASADKFRKEEIDALSAITSVLAWMSRDEQGIKLLESDVDELEPTLRLLTAQLSGGARKSSVVVDDNAKSTPSAQPPSEIVRKLVSALVVKIARTRILLEHARDRPVDLEDETDGLAPSLSSKPPKPPLIVATDGHF